MNEIVNGFMKAIGNGGWIDTLKELVSIIRDVIEVFRTILYLIGKLFGG